MKKDFKVGGTHTVTHNEDFKTVELKGATFDGRYIQTEVNSRTIENTPKGNSSDDRKNTPIFSGVLMYFPDAISEISKHSKRGNDKHNPGQALHWSKEKSKDHADCISRHLIDIGPNWDSLDHETQSLHATALAWRALALLQTVLERSKNDSTK